MAHPAFGRDIIQFGIIARSAVNQWDREVR
jgi:hypothetical protein